MRGHAYFTLRERGVTGVSMSVVVLSSPIRTSLHQHRTGHDDMRGKANEVGGGCEVMSMESGNEAVGEAERRCVAVRQTVKVNLDTRKILAWECMKTAWL